MLSADGLAVELDAEPASVRAIDGLSLAIGRGETFALVGESGCGKSMTALALMRLLPETGRYAAGRVVLDETDLLGLPERSMREVRGGRIGMIFQEPGTSLNPVMPIGAQIVESIEAHTALRGAAARARAIDWLERVGIPEPKRRIDDHPHRLSGGQKQRVMIAIALAAEPDFLLADEPTTALDVTIQAQILELLQELQRERRLGLLLITHDLAVVSGIAHRVALMYAGQIVEVADAPAFFGSPRHPYARLLLAALPKLDPQRRPLAAIAGTVPSLAGSFTGCRFAPRCDRVLDRCTRDAPPFFDVGGTAVRCWWYAPGFDGEAAPRTAARGPAASAIPGASRPLSAETPPLLSVRHLSVRFPVGAALRLRRPPPPFLAVDDVSFEIRPGQTVALVGESGSGKTTVGKALLRLLGGRAIVDGRVELGGVDLLAVGRAGLRRARRDIQMVFQDPYASLDPRMRVDEILAEGLRELRPELDAEARRSALLRIVERVGLRPDALERYPHAFSGGQRQRIAIARALVVEPKLIVCDEPTSALDVSVQAQVLNLLRELQATAGIAYLLITHNFGVVDFMADDVIVMNRGKVEAAGSPEALRRLPPRSYTGCLLNAVPKIDR